MLPSNEKKMVLGFECQPGDVKTQSHAQAPNFILSHVLQPDSIVATIGVLTGEEVDALIKETQADDLLRNWKAEPIVNVWRCK